MFCPVCGTQYEGNFCPNGCNSPKHICPKCKTEYAGSFCPKCGNRLNDTSFKRKRNNRIIILVVIFSVIALLITGITLICIDYNNKFNDAMEKADLLIQQGELEEAKAVLEEWDSSTQEAYYVRYAELYLAQGDYLSAYQILELGKNHNKSSEQIQKMLDDIYAQHSVEIDEMKRQQEEEKRQEEEEKRQEEELSSSSETQSTVSSDSSESHESSSEESSSESESSSVSESQSDDSESSTANREKEEYIASCAEITYRELARNPDKYKGERFKLTGQVIQVVEPTFLSDTTTLRINITPSDFGYYQDTIIATVELPKNSDRILTDDILTIYGECRGMYTYTSILGQRISLPKIEIEYFELQ